MYPYLTLFGISVELYYVMYGVGLVAAVAASLALAKRLRFSRLQAALLTLAGFALGVLGAKLMSYVYIYAMKTASGGAYVPVSGVCLFGALLIMPLFPLLVSRPLKRPAGEASDLLAPGIFLVLAFSKVGCTLGGCCFGVPAAHGIVTPYASFRAFPVQPCEALCTFIVTAFLLVRLYRAKNRRTGDLYPIGMMLYCAQRFFWERFRYYAEPAEARFLGPLTFWQTVSLFSFIIAAIWLAFLYRRKQLPDFSDPKYKVEVI